MKTYRQLTEELNSTHLKEAEVKITAADFENFITVAFNGGPNRDKETPIKSMDAYNNSKPALKKIVSALKKKGFKGKMTQTGKAQGKLNSSWLGKDSTPKSDMVVGKHGISLKKRGGSQLMSAKKAETVSTFNAAVEFMDSNAPKNATRLAKNISGMMNEFAVPSKVGTIGQFLDKAKGKSKISGKTEKQLASEYLSKTGMFKKMTGKVVNFFEENDDFKNYFVYEAATGANKFKGDKLPAAADYIVAFDEISGDTSIHQISKGYGKMGSYIPELAGGIKLRFSWKTHSSKSQKTFPSFRADVREGVCDEEPTFKSMFDSEFSVIEEGIVGNLVNKISGFLKKVSKQIMSLAKKGVSAILKFFGIVPKYVSMPSVNIT